MTRLIIVAQICLLPLTLLLGAPRAVHAQETWTTLPTITTSDTTGEKPQSKVWFNGHTWWAVLPTTAVAPTGTWLFRLEPNNTWTPVLQVTSLKGKADTKAIGNITHVLVAGTSSSQLVSLEYVPASNTYQQWSVRPTPTTVYVGETGTIEIDSTNRMWLATDSSSAVEVYYSDYPYSTFTGPLYLANDTGSGQISAIAALPNNTIGVFWTNFAAQRWGFRAHVDGTDPTVWLADEAPGWAYHPNQNMADDHVNLAVASDGTLYAAVKAGHASSSVPLMYLLVRHPGSGGSGTWDDIYTVGNSGTRPALVLNEDTQKLQVFISQSGGIYLYESAKWPISFGPGQLALSGTLNDPTSTKDTWAGRLVMLASNGGTHGLLITSVQGLVGSWKMNEGSGTQLRDTSGWGNNANLSGSPAWTPVLNGYALTLNGSTHGVVSDQANLNLTTAITLSAWVKPNLLATQDVISRATFGSVDGYALSLLSNGKASVHFNQASFGDIYRLDSTTSYPTSGNTWMHVAATYDGSTMRLYINGVEENWTPGPAAIAANLLSVGIAGQANGSRRFRGDMDDVRVYNYALTPAEVATLSNNGPVKADLMVTKSDSVTTVYSGLSTVTYNIQVTNLGPSNVAAATVSDIVSSKLTGVTWTCTASSGSSCTASGSGSINDPISLEAGDSAYYTLQGTVSGSATGTLSNTASVSAPGVNDPVPGNNSATDVDTIEQAVVPSISVQPANVTVTQPNSATFSVTASGTAPLSYQWRRNGVAISGAITSSYVLNPTSGAADNGAQYSVVVSNIAGNLTSASATLTVNVTPSITTQPASTTANAPNQATFTVVAAGTAPLSYQWRRNGANISGATNATYVLNPTAGTDSGAVFSVVVTNVAGSVTSANATLTVNLPPSITTQPANVTVTVPGAASFSVVATGTAPLSYQWRRNGTNISGATNASYVLNPTALSDNGAQFSVVVTNVAGSVTSAAAILTATSGAAPPSITTQPSSVTVTAPAAANFSVVATGDAPLSYQWKRNGTNISGATSSSYSLNPTAVTDTGAQFSVAVSNAAGSVTSSIANLTVNSSGGGGPSGPIFDVHFDTTADGFTYVDDTFRGTSKPNYASGNYIASGAYTGGGLRVLIGGINSQNIQGMSGGWRRSFTLAAPSTLTISFRYRLTEQNTYETDEYSQALFSLDSTLIGIPPNDYLAQVVGGGALSTGWQLVQFNLGTIPAGSHTITLGGFNNQKTYPDEFVEMFFDDLLLAAVVPIPPSITTQPANVTVTEPGAANFSVVATGDAPLSYQWRRNGVNISGATSASYSLNPTSAAADNGAQYTVLVVNGAGSATSATATLTVNPPPVPPSITTQPASLTVTAPGAANFSVVATGDAPLSYQWKRNGVNIGGATSASYALNPTAVSDSGAQFSVVVTNAVGNVTSTVATLTVNPASVPPSITTQPANVTVTAPNAANFSVVATGDAPLSYQWKRNGVNIGGAISSTYSLNPTAVSDSGSQFTVVVSNAVGTVTSAIATLTVNPAPVPPAITTQPANVTVTEPAGAGFSVAATGTAPLSYQWRRNGVNVGGATSSSYTLTPTAAASDNGALYDVVVSNAAGTATSTAASLTVQSGGGGGGPIFDVHFDTNADGFTYADDVFRGTNQPSYAAGAHITSGGFTGGALRVNVGGVNNTTIVNMSGGWQRNFVLAVPAPITLSFRYRLTESAGYEDDELSQMLMSVDGVLHGIAPNDYIAQVVGEGTLSTGWQLVQINLGTLSAGSHTLALGGYNNKKTTSDEISEILIDDLLLTYVPPTPPSITTQPASVTVTEPAAAGFSVVATGDAPLSYQWRRNGVAISGATSASYTLNPTSAAADNAAQFDVVVSNPGGSVTSTAAILTVQSGGGGGETSLFDVHFTTDADGFAYQDDLFRGTNEPGYAAGNYIASGGFTGGALRVSIGGINSQNVPNMSGGWHRNFTLAVPTAVTLSFRYRLTETAEYEEDEFSQMLVSVDGVLHGISPNDYIAQVVGGGPTTTGWQLVQLNLGTLGAGTHSVAFGGYNNQKTYPDESVEVLIDDAAVTSSTPAPPSITTQPSSLTVTSPNAAGFSVVASGAAPLSYQWRRSGVPISGATASSYTLNPTAVSDSGAQFDVVVSNPGGTTTSAAATLTVNPAPVPPSITTQPASLTVTAPNAANFSVVATGDAPLSYQWRRYGVAISGATSATYAVNPTAVPDSGSLDVVVSNGAGTVTSNTATLTVNPAPVPPSITTHPANLTVTAPNAANFSVVATGDAPLSYQWRRDGSAISGATSASYALNPTAVADNGALFDVIVSNAAGSATSTVATLTVNPAPVPPSITTHPASLTVTAPNAANFSVVATGNAPLSYQWRRNGTAISGATSATYAVNPTAVADSGSFDVVVSNGAGTVTSNAATLTVNPAPVPPSITTHPASLTVTAPNAANFSVVATGDAPLSYQWRRNGTAISGATSASYALNLTAVSDSGAQFVVVVSNGAGTVTSNVATLTVNPAPVPPSITTQPTNLTVTAPNAAQFSVVATGDAPLSYQWRRNGTAISGATSASYALNPTAVSDSGALFDVIVSNAAGSATSTVATLTVNPAPVPPSITTHPASLTVTAPNAANFSVVATGNAPLSYQWRRNGTAISGATSATYAVNPTAVADSGSFDVVVSNGAGTVTSNAATLTVNPAPVPPSITTHPASLTVTAPNAANFSVVATGDAPLSYQWRRNGTAISGATSASYALNPTAVSDSGAQFVVVVSNGAGTVTSNVATLTVNPAPVPPSITTQPTNLTVTAPGSAQFSVVATGDAPLSYQWRRNGTSISGATSASYVLNSTVVSDSGAQFDVVVSNGVGTVTSNAATLTVNPTPVPPGITTHPANLTVTAPASATFSVVATGDAPLSYQWRRNGTAISGATSASYVLNPTAVSDSGAQFDVIVSNAVGSITSNAATLTVNPAPVPPSITTQPSNVTVTAPNAANFSVVAAGDAPLSYQWRRNGVDIAGATSSSYTLDPTALGDSGALFSVVVTNGAGTVTSASATLTVNIAPGITTQPANVTVTAPASATFTVVASGTAPFTYQWRRNSVNIAGANGASYVLNPTAGSDGGATFDVVVSNAAGSVTSASATLTVNVPPAITTQPANLTVTAPASATFSVVATGTSLSYQWRRNGVAISGATSASYVLNPTAVTDSGSTFDVVVSNVTGSVTSAAATLTVQPSGTVTLIDANFNAGSDGFAYADDLFRSTIQPLYATGSWLSTGGFSGGGVQVQIGGVNGQNVPNLSGGWQNSFNLATSGQVTLTLRYNLSMVKSRTDRFGQVLASIDGVLKGISPADYLVQLAGTGGGGTSTTGWVQVQINIGTLSAGNHTLSLGGYMTRKSALDELAVIVVDDVLVTVTQ